MLALPNSDISQRSLGVVSSSSIKNLIMCLLLLFSSLGYIPTMPYWLYNISFVLSMPVFLSIAVCLGYFRMTKTERVVYCLILFSFFFSYISSVFPFNFSACLRGLTPFFIYLSVRALDLKITSFYINVLMVLLSMSFLFALYEFFYLPSYIINESGEWVITNEGFYLLKRAGSFLGNANVFGVFTVVCAIIIYTHWELLSIWKKPLILYVITFMNIFILAKSRTAMLALFICILYLLFVKKKYKVLIVFIGIIGVLSFYILSNLEHEVVDSIFRTSSLLNNKDNSYSLRADINSMGIALISENLWFGVGVGNESLLMQSVNAVRPGVESASLNILLERGVFGYAILFSVFLYFFVFSSSLTNRLLGLTIFVVDFFETVFIYPQIFSVMVIYLALYANSGRKTNNYNQYFCINSLKK